MNKMYEYLEEHAYISKNKKSNYQFELSKARAECIVNKYNSLCEEKDKEIERLKIKWDKLKKWANEPKVYICNYHILDKMNEIEQGSENNE